MALPSMTMIAWKRKHRARLAPSGPLTMEIPIVDGADDATVSGAEAAANGWPIVEASPTASVSDAALSVQKRLQSTQYVVKLCLLRFDTSPLSGLTVVGATLRIYIVSWLAEDGRSLGGEWYPWGPVDASDWTTTYSDTAFSAPIAGLTAGDFNDIVLTDAVANIDTEGFTGLRLQISGDAPTSNHNVQIEALDTVGTERHAVLIVEYEAA